MSFKVLDFLKNVGETSKKFQTNGVIEVREFQTPKLRSPNKSMHDDLPIGTTPPGSKHARGLTSKFYTEEQSIHPEECIPTPFFVSVIQSIQQGTSCLPQRTDGILNPKGFVPRGNLNIAEKENTNYALSSISNGLDTPTIKFYRKNG